MSRTKRELTSVQSELVSNREWADEVRQTIALANYDFRPLKPVVGNSFRLNVRCSGRESGFGFERSYGEYGLLLLKLEYADGDTQYEVVEIPPGRGRRSMTVEVP